MRSSPPQAFRAGQKRSWIDRAGHFVDLFETVAEQIGAPFATRPTSDRSSLLFHLGSLLTEHIEDEESHIMSDSSTPGRMRRGIGIRGMITAVDELSRMASDLRTTVGKFSF